MSNVNKNSLILLVVLSIFLGTAQFVLASEVTGSLSSDGSSDTSQEAVLGDSDNVTIAQNSNSGQLQGSVIEGRDDNGMNLADASAWGMATWVVPISGVALAALAFFLWRRNLSL